MVELNFWGGFWTGGSIAIFHSGCLLLLRNKEDLLHSVIGVFGGAPHYRYDEACSRMNAVNEGLSEVKSLGYEQFRISPD